ncbi:methenyltetrahydrofolate cyclohydrolase, partial [candidate division GN15 bacterium]|nr:methenyltetrahydrofolate cyclohydrolase [candidate division GN15 bacterium]
MVCRLTVGKKQFEDVKDELSDIRDKGDALRAELEKLVETDKEAFNKVMEAFKASGDEKDELVESANKVAADVPLTVMKA